ncbi:arginine decarboxylase [Bradyrhizobium sp. i1.15.2]
MNLSLLSTSPAERLADVFGEAYRLLLDPPSWAALATLSDHDMDCMRRIERNFFGILSVLDNSGSNPKLLGKLAEVNVALATAYGAAESQFVEAGSSVANNRLGIALARRLALEKLPLKVVLDRNSHASALGSAALAGLDVEFVHREYDSDLDVTIPLSPTQVDERLHATGAHAVWIVSPTYDGYCPDLRAISAVCKRRSAFLIVDAAWGALHGLLECGTFPQSAIACGADACVVSLHKKGLGLSQSSVANFNDPILARYFRQAGELGLMTTSPLYFLPASVQVGLEALRSDAGGQAWRAAANSASQFRMLVDNYQGCRVVRAEHLGSGICGDPCHVLINVRETGVSGFQILQALGGADNDIEMATRDTVLLLFGPEHAGSAVALAHLFRHAVETAERGRDADHLRVPSLRPPRAMNPRDALMAPAEQVLLSEAVGRVAAQTIGAYPPGQAILCLGEEITREVADYLFAVERAGGRLKGVAGRLDESPIEVVAETTGH